MIATLGSSGIRAALGSRAITARPTGGSIGAVRGGASVAATLGTGSKSVSMSPVRVVTINATPDVIGGKFFVPALISTETVYLRLLNRGAQTLHIYGDHYGLDGEYINSAFIDLYVLPGTSATVEVNMIEGVSTTLIVYSTPQAAPADLWVQVAIFPSTALNNWEDAQRPRAVNDDAAAEAMVAVCSLVGGAGWESFVGVFNATALNGQTGRTITYYWSARTDAGVETSGSFDLSPGAAVGLQATVLSPTLAIVGMIEIWFEGREWETGISHIVFDPLAGAYHSYGITHALAEAET